MLMLVTTAALAGALLAFRFTVLILLPVTLIAIVGVLAVGLTTGTEAWIVFLQTMGVIVSIQLGHLAGALIRVVFPSPR